MKPLRHFFLPSIAAGTFALLTANLVWAQSYSHARIVRLSFVEGDVTVERPDVQTWAQAPVNTPLQEGFKLSTGENSFAEVQFENGGTIRLGQLAILDFSQLALTASGGKINHVQLEQGYATFHARLDNGEDSYEVVTPTGTLTARDNTLFRVDLDQGLQRVEVFKGTVDVASNIGTWALEKNSVLELRPGASEPATVSQGITKDDWDHWVEERESRAEMSRTGPMPNSSTDNTANLLYGWGDLGEYGNWSYVPGWGYGWMPTLVGSGWVPFSLGSWCWYPGWGYTWISAEPWGWLPYHYGGWEFVAGVGWVWFPGNFGTWSPALVTWYAGSGWIGWVPRLHPVHGRPTRNPGAGGIRGGGAVVSTSTFRNGGRVNSASVLGLNPTTGEKINEPGIQPTVATMLPGPAVPRPAAQAPVRAANKGNSVRPALGNASAQGKTFTVKGGHEAAVEGAAGAVAPAMPVRRIGVAAPDSAIIYDPQADRYENSHRVTPAQASEASRTGPTVTAAPAARPGLVEPSPAGNRDLGMPAAGAPGLLQPNPAVGTRTAKVAPATGAATTRVDVLPRGAMGVHAPSVSRGGPSVAPAKAGPSVSSGGISSRGGFGGGGGGQAPAGGHAGGTAAGRPRH
jgi:hypothetical protein